jgi:pilus assembly protein CpaB
MKSNNKTTIVLLLCALLAGAGGWYISQNYISNEITTYKSSFEAEREAVEVVVANRDLNVGDVVSGETASIRKIPKIYLPKDAILPSNFSLVDGRQVVHSVNRGEPILPIYVVKSKIDGLSSLVGIGERAITIPVSTLDTFSGFLSPGDYIDLMITLKDGDDNRTVPLAQNLRVIAAGKDLDDGVPDQSQKRYSEITLSVTPLYATRLIHAQTLGEITVLLRRPEDESDRFDGYVTVENLVDIPQEPKPAPPPKVEKKNGWGFEIIKGGKRS